MKKIIFFAIAYVINHYSYSQVPFEFISNSNNSAERVAKYGSSDVSNDFMEITNSTQFENSFIPSIWAHQQSDNRFVLRLFSTTNTARDNGNIPMMIFRAELRDNLNPSAPVGGTFPWGLVKADVTNRPLFAWENGNTQLMRLMPNGFLGINTVTPTALFHTVGSVRFEDLPDRKELEYILGSDNQGNVFKFKFDFTPQSNNDRDWLKPDDTYPDSINDIIYTRGSVGINISNPTASLHTFGNLRFENLPKESNPNFVLGTDFQGNVYEYSLDLTSSKSDEDWLKTNGSVSSSIDDNIYTIGKVGINVSDMPSSIGSINIDSYSLFVTGGILTEEIRIIPKVDWPDFVFKKNYDLPTIEEVEKFINENGSLIDVPNASDVKSDGIELGEMNATLLKKIEELTIYIIQLNKKINEQDEEIKKMKYATEK